VGAVLGRGGQGNAGEDQRERWHQAAKHLGKASGSGAGPRVYRGRSWER
jgi:hypothetical protein